MNEAANGRRRGTVTWWRRAGVLAAALLISACGGGDDAGQAGPARLGARGAVPKDSAGTMAAGSEAGTGIASDGVDAATARDRAGAPRVVIAGTSLTAGLGLDPSRAYPAVLQRIADSAGVPAEIVNAGLSGETSAGLVRRIDWLLRERADVVVIETGANDGLRGLNPDSTRANLRRIVASVRERLPRARVLLVQMEAPPNLGPSYTRAFHDMYPEVARETGATLVPFLLDGVAGLDSLNQADGMHPNVAGARIVARTVWGTLGPVLRQVAGAPVGG